MQKNVSFCQIWRNFTYLHMTGWRNQKFTLFCCCKICFVTNYTVFAKSVFARFCVEKNWAKNWIGGEKMTNIRRQATMIRMMAITAPLESMKLTSWTPSNWRPPCVCVRLQGCLKYHIFWETKGIKFCRHYEKLWFQAYFIPKNTLK